MFKQKMRRKMKLWHIPVSDNLPTPDTKMKKEMPQQDLI